MADVDGQVLLSEHVYHAPRLDSAWRVHRTNHAERDVRDAWTRHPTCTFQYHPTISQQLDIYIIYISYWSFWARRSFFQKSTSIGLAFLAFKMFWVPFWGGNLEWFSASMQVILNGKLGPLTKGNDHWMEIHLFSTEPWLIWEEGYG